MKAKTCCFIGHQNLRDYDIGKMKIALEEQINKLIEDGVEYFISSCRRGFETLAALKVIEIQRKKFYDSNLLIISPYDEEKKDWVKNWSKRDMDTYEYIRKHAKGEYIATSESYGNLLGAHKDIIDLSTHVLVAFEGGDLGAIAGAVGYAIIKNKEIIYLDMKNLLRDFKKVSKEDAWETRRNFVFNYSVDFSREKLNHFLEEYNIEFPLEEDEETYKKSVDPDKEENFKLAKNIFYSIAEENDSKVTITQSQAIPYQIIELENDKLKAIPHKSELSKELKNDIIKTW